MRKMSKGRKERRMALKKQRFAGNSSTSSDNEEIEDSKPKRPGRKRSSTDEH
jgi:hypothetical protein